MRGRETFKAPTGVVEMVNAALYCAARCSSPATRHGQVHARLRGGARTRLGPVLRGTINSRSALRTGLYQYDAIARLREANLARTAGDRAPDERQSRTSAATSARPARHRLAAPRPPRVLLIDEIDKSDIDLPNDLLQRLRGRASSRSPSSRARPSEGTRSRSLSPASERAGDRSRRAGALPDFPVRRASPATASASCRRRSSAAACASTSRRRRRKSSARSSGPISAPSRDRLLERLLTTFVDRRSKGALLATDQLLNAFFLVTRGASMTTKSARRSRASCCGSSARGEPAHGALQALGPPASASTPRPRSTPCWLASHMALILETAPLDRRRRHGVRPPIGLGFHVRPRNALPHTERAAESAAGRNPRDTARDRRPACWRAPQPPGRAGRIQPGAIPRAAGLVGERGIPGAMRALRRKRRLPPAPIDEDRDRGRATEDDLWLPIYRRLPTGGWSWRSWSTTVSRWRCGRSSPANCGGSSRTPRRSAMSARGRFQRGGPVGFRRIRRRPSDAPTSAAPFPSAAAVAAWCWS